LRHIRSYIKNYRLNDTQGIQKSKDLITLQFKENYRKYLKYYVLSVSGYLLYSFTSTKPQQTKLSVKASKVAGRIASLNIPTFLRKPIFSLYIKTYNVNTEEILEKDLKKYRTINEFFIREIDTKKRPSEEPSLIVSPCDGRILTVSEVKNLNELIIVKDIKYDLFTFLFGSLRYPSLYKGFEAEDDTNNTKLMQVTIYLSPGDCHRYFSPANMKVEDRVYIPGGLFPVKPSYVNKHPDTFIVNERVTLKCSMLDNKSKLFVTYVGALNVGSIFLNYDGFCNESHRKIPEHTIYGDGGVSTSANVSRKDLFTKKNAFNEFDNKEFDMNNNINDEEVNSISGKEVSIKKSEEMGYFRFGSTIVLIFPIQKGQEISDKVKPGEKIQIGNKIL